MHVIATFQQYVLITWTGRWGLASHIVVHGMTLLKLNKICAA